MKKAHPLADCSVPIPLRCHHCSRELPKFTTIDVFENYVVAECPKCKLWTPFKLEKAA